MPLRTRKLVDCHLIFTLLEGLLERLPCVRKPKNGIRQSSAASAVISLLQTISVLSTSGRGVNNLLPVTTILPSSPFGIEREAVSPAYCLLLHLWPAGREVITSSNCTTYFSTRLSALPSLHCTPRVVVSLLARGVTVNHQVNDGYLKC